MRNMVAPRSRVAYPTGPGLCSIRYADFREVVFSAYRRAGHRCPYRASSRSKHTSQATSPSTAWKRSSGSFVKRDQYAIAVPLLPITLHTYLPPLHLMVGANDVVKDHFSTCEDVSMHSLGYAFRRTHHRGSSPRKPIALAEKWTFGALAVHLSHGEVRAAHSLGFRRYFYHEVR
jgi:hypothetical protein